MSSFLCRGIVLGVLLFFLWRGLVSNSRFFFPQRGLVSISRFFFLHRGPCFKINGLFFFLWPCLKCCVSSYAEALSQMFLSYVMRLCLRRFLLPPMMRPCFKSSVCLHMLRPCVSFFPLMWRGLKCLLLLPNAEALLSLWATISCVSYWRSVVWRDLALLALHVCHIDDQSRDVFLLSLWATISCVSYWRSVVWRVLALLVSYNACVSYWRSVMWRVLALLVSNNARESDWQLTWATCSLLCGLCAQLTWLDLAWPASVHSWLDLARLCAQLIWLGLTRLCAQRTWLDLAWPDSVNSWLGLTRLGAQLTWLGLTWLCAQFSIVECVMSALIDEFRRQMGTKRNVMYFRLAVVATSFLLGLPMVCSVSMIIIIIPSPPYGLQCWV